MEKISSDNELVSVIMAVYKGLEYLHDSIQSILAQSYTKFELIIVKDNCGKKDIDDAIDEIVNQFHDSRIRYIVNDERIGFVASLNKGIQISRGKYIARLDADDLSLPNRLELQISYLKENSDVGLVGSCFFRIDESNRIMDYCNNLTGSDKQIKNSLVYGNQICHPSIMIKKDILTKNSIQYEKIGEIGFAEDYILWSRLVSFTKFHILEKPLILYRCDRRENRTAYSRTKQDELYKCGAFAFRNYCDYFGVEDKFNTDSIYLYLHPTSSLLKSCSGDLNDICNNLQLFYKQLTILNGLPKKINKEYIGILFLRYYRRAFKPKYVSFYCFGLMRFLKNQIYKIVGNIKYKHACMLDLKTIIER